MRRAAIVLLLVAGSAGCGSEPASADLVSFNYCGNVCAGGGDEGASFVSDLVTERDATVVVLQEVCRSQAERLRAELEGAWETSALAYVTTFDKDLDGANRCDGDDYGMAVLAPVIGDEEIVVLPNPGLGRRQLDERKILCADVGDFTACTTHLVREANDPDAHTEQVAALGAFLDGRRSARIVLAGDINERVPVPAPGFVVDHHRLDHVYASRSLARDVSASTARCDCSDHPALLVDIDRA